MPDSIRVNIQDLVNLKKIEKGDILVLYHDDDEASKKACESDISNLAKSTGAFIITSPKSMPIEKMTRAEFIRIAGYLDIKLA